MRKGAIPVPYIIALILGIIVVGLLAYWFFVLGGKLPIHILENECRAKENVYCTEWSANAYADDQKPGDSDFSEICPADDAYAPECCSFEWARIVSETTCKTLLGQT